MTKLMNNEIAVETEHLSRLLSLCDSREEKAKILEEKAKLFQNKCVALNEKAKLINNKCEISKKKCELFEEKYNNLIEKCKLLVEVESNGIHKSVVKEKPKYQYNIYFPLDMKLNKYDSDGLSKFGSNGSLIAMKGDTWSHMDCYTDEPFEVLDDYFCSPNTQSNCQLIKCKTIDTPSSKYVKYYNYIVTYPNIDVLNAYDKRGLKKFGIDYDGSVDKFDGDDFKYASITSLKCPSVIDKYFNSPKSDSVDVEILIVIKNFLL